VENPFAPSVFLDKVDGTFLFPPHNEALLADPKHLFPDKFAVFEDKLPGLLATQRVNCAGDLQRNIFSSMSTARRRDVRHGDQSKSTQLMTNSQQTFFYK
jgi:hypothetical protein